MRKNVNQILFKLCLLMLISTSVFLCAPKTSEAIMSDAQRQFQWDAFCSPASLESWVIDCVIPAAYY